MADQSHNAPDSEVDVDKELLEDLEERPENAEDVKGGAKVASSIGFHC
jgi:hypothetical protein